MLIHAGTRLENGVLYTNGGRVLNIVAVSSNNDLSDCKTIVYNALNRKYEDNYISRHETIMYGLPVTICMILSNKKANLLWRFSSERRFRTTGSPPSRVSTGVHAGHSDFDLFFETLAEAVA